MAPQDGPMPGVENEEGITLSGFATDVILTIPSDLERIAQLEQKLVGYYERLGDYAEAEPDLQATRYPDAAHKAGVLSRVIERGQVSCFELAKELAEYFGQGFHQHHFQNAFLVIEDYLLTGGENVQEVAIG